MNRKNFIFLGIAWILCVNPVFASLPGDINSDNQITSGELTQAILNHLENRETIPQDLGDAAWIYKYWNGTSFSFTDSGNRTLTLDRPIRRLVAYDGSSIETLRSLNATGLIVGVSNNVNDEYTFFPEFQNFSTVGTVWSPDIEALMKTRPDTVFLYGSISQDSVNAIEEKVKEFDPSVRIIRFDFYRPESYSEEVRKLGKILGKDDDAETFLDFYEPIMKEIHDRIESIPMNQRKKIYFESWNAYKSAAPGSGYHEKITFAGGNNIFAEAVNPYPAVDPEAILRLAPEGVIKQVGAGEADVGGYNDPDSHNLIPVYDDLLNRTGWNTLPAVQNKQIHVIHSDILGSSSHFIGLQYLAKWFYPEKFADIDPLKTHREYLKKFQHLQFDPAIRGGFVYP